MPATRPRRLEHESITKALLILAANQPAAPALHVPCRKSLTFGDLGAQIRYLRERLGSWDIAPGDIVAGFMPGRPEMAAACMALPSSCTFAPLGNGLTTEAYEQLIHRMGAQAVVAPGGQGHPIFEAARKLGVAEIDVVADPGSPAGSFALELRNRGSLGKPRRERRADLAYILTSSGTTGRQKLVPGTHYGTLLHAEAAREWLQYSPADVGCHLSPIHMGNGLRSGLINPLFAGASIVCLPESDLDSFFRCLQEFRPTCLNGSFALFRAILRRAPEYREAIGQARFRFLRAGAGRLRPEEIDQLEEIFNAPVLVGFSSVEAVISHDPLPPGARKRGAAGLPLLNEVAVRMDSGEIVQKGGPGEIVVRGPQVFPGYLDDPELTAASFAGDWFRTGDLGRIDGDGYVYLLGRLKEVINRGGEKISPVEIDAILESLPGVAEAGTFGIPHASLGEEVAAAVVPHAGATLAEQDLIEAVRRRVGIVKAPRRVYLLDRLPRTGNGKVLRRELLQRLGLDHNENTPREVAEGVAEADPAQSPHSPLEGALTGMWSALLQVTNIGRHDNFFLLGGDSLHGQQLLAQIRDRFGVDLPIQSLFTEAITIAGMARAMEAMRLGHATQLPQPDAPGAADRSSVARIPRRAIRNPAVLTPAQWRTWFLAQMDSGSAAYHQSRAHRLTGRINIAALRASLQALVRRHEILRTTFTAIENEPRQIVRDALLLDFEFVDLSVSQRAPSDALAELLGSVAQEPFDFESGPLARFRLIRLAEEEHVFLRVWHHIISDGWSTGIFERDLSAAYTALSEGRAFEPPPLAVQYADYAVWQSERLSERALGAHLDYWRKKLADVQPLDLPTDRPRQPEQRFRGASLAMTLPFASSAALRDLAKGEDVTLFMASCALCCALLSRSAAQEDVAVGVPIANRDAVELQEIIGPFVNTLVFRLDLSGDPTVRELLQRAKETAVAAYAHGDVPFERLVEELKPARVPNRNPLFQVLFSQQNAPREGLRLPGIEAAPFKPMQETAKFDLSFFVADQPGGLEVRLEYDTDLFDEATAQRLLAHYRVLLEGAVKDPESRLSGLPLMAPEELQQIVVDFNSTAVEIPRGVCIHHLIARQAARTPGAVAIISEDGRMTYAELNAAANRMAHFLIKRGAGPDVPVCVFQERSPRLVVAILAILKAGSAYLPLDPAYPRQRLHSILEDARSPIIVTEDSLVKALPPFTGVIISLDKEGREIESESAEDPVTLASANNLAYVLFTSGSTGRPKGVSLEHRTAVTFIHWAGKVFTPQELAGVLFSTSICFDVSIFELFVTLSAGGRLILARDVLQLPDLPARNEITLMNLVPSAMVELIWAGGIPTSIKVVNFAGEALPEALLEQTYAATRAERVFNLYGPTETSYATFAQLRRDAQVTIGKPIANARVYILDAHRQPVPIGVRGEICIGGAGVARGYLHRPDLTAERFIADSFSGGAEGRLYRTGDVGRFLPDGNIQFLGRSDRQVKIRGFRIELGDVEVALAGHPAVVKSAVVESEAASGQNRLIAYVVLQPGRQADVSELRSFMKRALPDYMVPASFVFLESFPTLPSGKLDRQSLPEPRHAAAEDNCSQPRTQQEYQLIRIWEDLLAVSPIGIRDDFFALGGDSLLAVRLMIEIDLFFGKRLSISALFADPTVEGLARAIANQTENPERSPLIAIQSRGSKTPFFFLHGDFNGGGIYCRKLARHLGGDQPFYSVQPLGLETGELPSSIEAMAGPYLDLLRKIQPRGPYLLGGYCAGALAAFEMARRLKAQGEAVQVVLVDPVAKNSRFKWFWRALCRRSRSRSSSANGALSLASNAAEGSAEILMRGLETKSVYYRRLSRGFEASPYPGKITLILATGRPNSRKHERRRLRVARAWRRVAGEIEVHVVPGNHITCVTQHVEAIAEHLKAALSAAAIPPRSAQRFEAQGPAAR